MSKPLQIRVSEDRMEVILEGAALEDGIESLVGPVREMLAALKIEPLPSRDEILARLQAGPNHGNSLGRTVLAAGIAPIPPEDAVLVWDGKFFEAGYHVDEKTGAVDFRRLAAQPEVQTGQRLAHVKPASKGVPGVDVYGSTIKQGTPHRVFVRAGRHVRIEESGPLQIFYAEIAGRVCWDLRAISIDEVFRVGGDVDLKTGNVHHHGAVMVQGDVKQGFTVEADGDVEIHGSLEAAHVTCGGSLIVHGGITGGRAQTTVKVANAIQARFVSDAMLQAGGNVVIENEIVNATIHCQGTLKIPSGRIIGGKIHALAGIVAGVLGNERGMKTIVTAGDDPLAEQQIAQHNREIERLRKELEAMLKTTDPFLGREAALGTTELHALESIRAKEAHLSQTIRNLEEEIGSIQERAAEAACAQIWIRSKAHPDVVIQLRNNSLTIQEPIDGPFRFTLHENDVRLRHDQE